MQSVTIRVKRCCEIQYGDSNCALTPIGSSNLNIFCCTIVSNLTIMLQSFKKCLVKYLAKKICRKPDITCCAIFFAFIRNLKWRLTFRLWERLFSTILLNVQLCSTYSRTFILCTTEYKILAQKGHSSRRL